MWPPVNPIGLYHSFLPLTFSLPQDSPSIPALRAQVQVRLQTVLGKLVQSSTPPEQPLPPGLQQKALLPRPGTALSAVEAPPRSWCKFRSSWMAVAGLAVALA
jgi:hypothetical protein